MSDEKRANALAKRLNQAAAGKAQFTSGEIQASANLLREQAARILELKAEVKRLRQRVADDTEEIDSMRAYHEDMMRTVRASKEAAEAQLAALREGRGAKPLPRREGVGDWTLRMDLLSDLNREVQSEGWDSCTAEVTEIIALSVERRILSALSPAPVSAGDKPEDHCANAERLRAALTKIEEGLPAGSTLLSGSDPLWRDAYRDLQRIARHALSETEGE